MTSQKPTALPSAATMPASLGPSGHARQLRRSPACCTGPHPSPAPVAPASGEVATSTGPRVAPRTPEADDPKPTRQRADLIVRGSYYPETLHLEPDVPTVIYVERQAGSWCSDVLTIPALGIEVDLPSVEPVLVELPALSPGRYEITCGLQMLRGAIEVGRAATLTGTDVDARDVEGADRLCEHDSGGPRRRAS